MKGEPWEATMAGEVWKNDERKPLPGQTIIGYPLQTPKKIEKEEKWSQDACDTWAERHPCEIPYHLGLWTNPMVPDGEGGEESIANEKDYSIVLQMPEELKRRLVRIPRGAEWPLFKQLMDNMIGEHQWVAGFFGGI
jgi:hypothetical protein